MGSYWHSCHQSRTEYWTISFTSFLNLCGLKRWGKKSNKKKKVKLRLRKPNTHHTPLTSLTWLSAVIRIYLIWQRLRRRVPDRTAVCDTGDFSSHFQNMSQGQICYVNIIGPVGTQPEKVQSKSTVAMFSVPWRWRFLDSLSVIIGKLFGSGTTFVPLFPSCNREWYHSGFKQQ